MLLDCVCSRVQVGITVDFRVFSAKVAGSSLNQPPPLSSPSLPLPPDVPPPPTLLSS